MESICELEQDTAAETDPLLLPFLKADDKHGTENALRVLLERDAAPIIHGVLARKQAAASDGEDVASAAREQLIRQLGALRAGERAMPIRDFRSYVASVAYAAWADYLRNAYPQRSMLLNRIRYLLENRSACRGFALWEAAGGRKWCGIREWAGRPPSPPPPKLQWLLTDPVAAVRQAFGERYWQQNELSSLITDLFHWLETPIELRDLVFVVSEILEIADRSDSVISDADSHTGEESECVQPSAAEEVIWKEYLVWLWQQIAKLPTRQSAAFLLSSSVLREFELLGIGSIRGLAPLFAIAEQRLAAIWQQLPLDDLAIAAELDCTRQQVINLRRVARDSLSRAWSAFSGRT